MTLTLLASALLATSIAPLFFQKKDNLLITVTQILMVSLIFISVFYLFHPHYNPQYMLNFLNFNRIKLTLSIQIDMLTKIMMPFILVIGFLIYRYAQNYLESDCTRMRFLSQLNFVLLSVLLLAMSSNLLTAFLAWQLIGINLYVLLNHYHHNPESNRAAKKKFVINRIGDCSFLLAIILAYHTHSASSFVAIQSSSHSELICGLLFLSVMTKCAQFPFHIWLIDTMETPTPVSALMHAGVINAGGILLTRISAALMNFHALIYLILFVGLLSAMLSIHWMKQQPDTKKKLAYSTMGQMGYMLTQCSLGAFPAAIFHLISHGFYKASLFLNSGETLRDRERGSCEPVSKNLILKSFVISLALLFIEILIFKGQAGHIPLLMYGFILLTITTLILKSNMITKSHGPTCVFYYLVIGFILFVYLLLFHLFSQLLTIYEDTETISPTIQLFILVALCLSQYYSWTKKEIKRLPAKKLKDCTERALRQYLLDPLRSAGDIINIERHQRRIGACYAGMIIFTIMLFMYCLLRHGATTNDTAFYKVIIFIMLSTGIAGLTIANRCSSIKTFLYYLFLFELAFTNIALFDSNSNIVKIGFFHITNISTVLLMLTLLARKNGCKKAITSNSNRLPTRVFYLVFSLLLLIGIPGTASFISEFYLLSSLIASNAVFILMYITLIILVSIVVMHSLQLYAFNTSYSTLLLKPIEKYEHLIFWVIIIFNITCGLWPNVLLKYL